MNDEYVKEHYSWEDVNNIVAKLMDKDGCPWDRVQTHKSLEKCLRDECEEVVEAVENEDYLNLREELGDVLLQVLMNARIAESKELFTLEDVVDQLGKKLVRRHPHVFGDGIAAQDSEQGLSIWNAMKRNEKIERLEEYQKWVDAGKIQPEVMERYRKKLIENKVLQS